MPRELPDDEHRCRETGRKGRRCAKPRLPGTDLCRMHHLQYHFLLNRADSINRSSRSNAAGTVSDTTNKKAKATPVTDVTRTQEESVVTEETCLERLEPGQIWALPHELDGFPRAYGRVERVITEQHKAEVTLLDFHPLTKQEKQWANEGLPVSCGTFQPRESTVMKDLSSFSHQVVTRKPSGPSSLCRIFPQKGEVWAVYHKWDVSEKRFVYKLVEIVKGFEGECGVRAAALAWVPGSDGVFERDLCDGFELMRTFSRRELLRFSHRLRAVKLEGDGRDGSSGGPWKVSFTK